MKVKLSGNSLLGLALGFSSPTNEKKSILLAAIGDTLLTMNRFSSRFSNVIMPRQVTKSEQEPGWIIQKSSINMAGHVLTEIQALCYRAKPEKSAAVDADTTLSQAPSEYYAVLGDLKITTDGENTKFPPSNSWNVDSEFLTWSSGESKKLSVKIIWQLKDGNVDLFPKYNIFVEKLNSSRSWSGSRVLEVAKEYLGEAVVESFYVSDLEVPKGTSSLKFIIQVYGLDGASQKLEDSPFLQVKVDG